MSPSGIHINKSFIVIVVGVFGALILVYRFWSAKPTLVEKAEHMGDKNAVNEASEDKFWSAWKLEDIPAEMTTGGSELVSAKDIEVTKDGNILKVYSRQASPKTSNSEVSVLFLHGASFTSQNWEELGTLGLVALWGYRAVAIDLPGFGKTKGDGFSDSFATELISEVVKVLDLKRPVIVSPSMSGKFSLPYLFSQSGSALEKSRAFIPVAPVGIKKFENNYKNSKIPTMIVYGENDKYTMKEDSKNILTQLPVSKTFELQGAGHACYMNKPKEFHQLLFSFLKLLK